MSRNAPLCVRVCVQVCVKLTRQVKEPFTERPILTLTSNTTNYYHEKQLKKTSSFRVQKGLRQPLPFCLFCMSVGSPTGNEPERERLQF